MVANPGKLLIMFLGSKINNSKITFATENKQIKCKREMKLLRITIDEKLTSTKHPENANLQLFCILALLCCDVRNKKKMRQKKIEIKLIWCIIVGQ